VGDVEGAGVVFYGDNWLLLLDRLFVLFVLFVCLDVFNSEVILNILLNHLLLRDRLYIIFFF
jgi:hypothetical protein